MWIFHVIYWYTAHASVTFTLRYVYLWFVCCTHLKIKRICWCHVMETNCFPSQFEFDGNFVSIHSHLDSNRVIATFFYMARQLCCRGMCKICCYLMASSGIGARRSFHRISIAGKKPLVKRSTFPLDARICKWARLWWISWVNYTWIIFNLINCI